MNKKCVGCGVIMQCDKPEAIGYIEPEVYDKSNLCRRCFRLKFYGDYIFVRKSNEEYEEMLNNISQTGDLVVYMADMFNISDEMKYVDKLLNNPMLFVLTKRDILPRSVKDNKLLKYIDDTYHLDIIDSICISSDRNYNFDKLYKMIMKHKKSNNVYIVGNTNSGKSSFINKIIKNYSNNNTFITTSMLPTTTLDLMDIKINDKLTIIDTPGLVEDGSITDCYDYLTIKRIVPHAEIRTRTFQLNAPHSIVIENLAQIDYREGQRNSFTLYISNELTADNVNINYKIKVSNWKKYSFTVDGGEDIVISGLGWIKVVDKGIIDIIVNEKVKVFKRKSII